MKKIIIPEELRGKELARFLVANKSQLIAQKKSMIKWADPVSSDSGLFVRNDGGLYTKAESTETIPPDATSLRVKVVANTAMWCDSHMDVLLPDNGKKSLKERKGLIPHLHDHKHELGAEVGDVANIYYEDVPLSSLGVNKPGTAQALIFETDIRKEYNEMIFRKYKQGKIKQHSIGLMYVKLELAINDEESEKEYDFWKKYIDQIINREMVEEKGYYWVVPEIKLLENSAVLFGSNMLTPTLEAKADTDEEPPSGTLIQPSTQPKAFDVDQYISNLVFNF